MALDEDGSRRRGVFFTDTTNIFCVAQVGVGRPDVTLEILIRQVASAPIGTDAFESVNAVVAANEFHPELTKERPTLVAMSLVPTSLDEEGRVVEDTQAPFNAGSYKCEVYLDGEKVKSVDFNVDYPSCPTTVIHQGTPCLGYYTLNKECPASGLTGDQDLTCICEASGWNCQ